MSKQILTLLTLFCFAGSAFGQCSPDFSNTTPGLYPKPITPNAIKDINYTKNLTVVFNRDTSITIDTVIQIPGAPFPFPINTTANIKYTYYKIDSTGGLPPGMDFILGSCNEPACAYDIDTNNVNTAYGCLDFAGTPTVPGNYTPYISAQVDGYFPMPNLNIPIPIPGIPEPGTPIQLSQVGQQLPQAASFFAGLLRRTYTTRIIVEVGSNRADKYAQQPINIYPNPTTSKCLIKSEVALTEVRVLDALGRVVQQIATNNLPLNTIEVYLENLPAGIYTAQIFTKDGGLTTQLVSKQ